MLLVYIDYLFLSVIYHADVCVLPMLTHVPLHILQKSSFLPFLILMHSLHPSHWKSLSHTHLSFIIFHISVFFSSIFSLTFFSSLSSSLSFIIMTPEEWYRGLPPVTRVYWTAAVVATLLATIGAVSPQWLLIDFDLLIHKFQVCQTYKHYYAIIIRICCIYLIFRH